LFQLCCNFVTMIPDFGCFCLMLLEYIFLRHECLVNWDAQLQPILFYGRFNQSQSNDSLRHCLHGSKSNIAQTSHTTQLLVKQQRIKSILNMYSNMKLMLQIMVLVAYLGRAKGLTCPRRHLTPRPWRSRRQCQGTMEMWNSTWLTWTGSYPLPNCETVRQTLDVAGY
jgi:hypothetical protein